MLTMYLPTDKSTVNFNSPVTSSYISLVTSRSNPNSLTEVILNFGETAVPFSQTASSLVSKNTWNVIETLAGFAIKSIRSVLFEVSISTGATFMSGLETVNVQFSTPRFIMKLPSEPISSTHSRPFESVAMT